MRFGSAIAAIAALSATTPLLAQSQPLISPEFAQQLRSQERMIQEGQSVADAIDPKISEEVRQEAQRYADRAARASMSAILQAGEGASLAEIAPDPDDPALEQDEAGAAVAAPRYAVLVSASMPEAELRAAFAELALDGVAFYFRGFHPETTSLAATMRRIAALVDGLPRRPDVFIDPTPFRVMQVDSVPAVFIRDTRGNVLLQARGNMNIDYLEEKLQHHRGPTALDLGVIGPTYPIAETDLVVEIQRRIAAVDWEKKKSEAMHGFWDHATFQELDIAREDSVRRIDPSVLVTKDFEINQPGQPTRRIASAGDRLNPLDHTSFNRRVFIFDATDPRQVEIVEREARARADIRQPIFIASKLSREDGWDNLGALSRRVKAPLFLLTPELRRMFRVRAVPSIVTAEGRLLVIEEVEVPL